MATVFVAVTAALAIWLVWKGGKGWFLYDDWMWIGARRGLLADGDLAGYLLRPHNEHLSLLPVVIYDGVIRLWGLDTILPIVVVLIGLHVGIVVLARQVMLRAGVGQVIASSAAVLLLLPAAGSTNVVAPFQITLLLPLFAFLAQLQLVDHTGPVDRRDHIGAALGVIAIASNSFGVLAVGAIAALLAFRRRPAAAALAVIPAAVVYGLWWLTYSEPIPRQIDLDFLYHEEANTPMTWLRFFARGAGAVGQGVAPITFGGALVAVGFLVTVAVLVHRHRDRTEPALAMAGLAIVFYATTAVVRARNGLFIAEADRYVYLAMVLVTPVLALGVRVGIDAHAPRLGRLVRPATTGVAALLLAMLLLNGRTLNDRFNLYSERSNTARERLAATVGLPGLDQVSPDLAVAPGYTLDLLLTDVHRLADDGLLLPTSDPDPTARLDVMNDLLVVSGQPVQPGDRPAVFTDLLGGRFGPERDGCIELVEAAPGRAVLQVTVPAEGPASLRVGAPEGTISVRTRDASQSSEERQLAVARTDGGGTGPLRLLARGASVEFLIPRQSVVCGVAGLTDAEPSTVDS